MKQYYMSWRRVFALFLFCSLFHFSNSTPSVHSSNYFFTAAGVISASQIICDGDAPATLVETAAPTIGGPLEYLWMEATPGNAWVPIPSATGSSFTPPAISETTTYTRCVRLAGSSDDYIETNVVTITVVENSVADIITPPGTGNVGQVLSFSAATSPNSTYSWDFGDGTPTTSGQSAIHIFGSNGNVTNTYTITLTVTNSNNCVQTFPHNIFITDVALPIDLLFFNAVDNEAGAVDLKWATASEQNNEYFDLERSNDGRNFSSIEKQNGAVNSNQIIYYSFRDETPANGDNYYRLKQVDINGDFEYSDIVTVRIKNGLTGFSFYPNPVKKELNAKLDSSLSEDSTLEIFNINGQMTRSFDLKNYLQSGISINLETMDAGTYFILIKDKNENIFTEKILKLD